MNFSPSHIAFLKALHAAGVGFLIVGGYAVNYYGYPRYTEDLDLWLKPDNANKEHLARYLQSEDFDSENIQQLMELDFTGIHVFQLGEGESRIGFLTSIPGVNFQEAYSRREQIQIENTPISFLSFEDLLTSKKQANRLRDQADIDVLVKVKK